MARKDPLLHLPRHAELSDALAREVRALGPAALPALRAMTAAPEAHRDEDTPAWRAARNAARLLADWPGAEVDAILLDAFAAAPVGSTWMGRVEWAVARRGPEVIDALLAFRGADRELEAVFAAVQIARRHERTDLPALTDWIAAIVVEDPGSGAALAKGWRDPALVAPLEARFDVLFAHLGVGEPRELLDLLEAADACGSTDRSRALRLRARLEVEVRRQEAELERIRTIDARLAKTRR